MDRHADAVLGQRPLPRVPPEAGVHRPLLPLHHHRRPALQGRSQAASTRAVHGVAKFAASGKGEAGGVPVGAVPKLARNHFPTIRGVDEFRSSAACRRCHMRTRAVVQNVTGDDGAVACRDVRGLKFCPNCTRLLKCDANTALNILDCDAAVRARRALPHYMTRGVPRDDQRPILLAEAKALHMATAAAATGAPSAAAATGVPSARGASSTSSLQIAGAFTAGDR